MKAAILLILLTFYGFVSAQAPPPPPPPPPPSAPPETPSPPSPPPSPPKPQAQNPPPPPAAPKPQVENPTAPPKPELPAYSGDPLDLVASGIVHRYYSLINIRDAKSAYQLRSPEYRNTNSFESFSKIFSATKAAMVLQADQIEATELTAVVATKIRVNSSGDWFDWTGT
ncbi:MAG: hypothetical protein AAF226_19590, partial [Verrucomicrobiota bacterium]